VATDETAGAGRRRLRVAGGWAVVTLVLALAGGALPGALGVALGVWHVVRPPAARTLLIGALAALALAPVAWVVGNAGRLGEVSPRLVTDNPWPGGLAAVGVTLLVAGTVLDERHDRAGDRAR
jgi:hypothetical protein